MQNDRHTRKIISIPADPFASTRKTASTERLFISNGQTIKQNVSKKRVVAYVRVSTVQEEQENSFVSQILYYKRYINSRSDWQLVNIYADKGLSGTSYKHRPEFKQMIADAEAGKIDLIITKSISRFARNTVDSLSVTRQLKTLGVEVFFEKENISSFDAKSELIFTILSSSAQEESRSISENVKWGMERSMEAGKINVPYKNFLGYKKGKDGYPEIVEEEANTIRKIYQLFLNGAGYQEIAKRLTDEGVLTPSRRTVWGASVVRSILTNEKYKGCATLGKTFVENYLTKKVKKNCGERKQWYIDDSHDAIIPPETFDKVQEIIRERSKSRKSSKKSNKKT